MELLQSKLSSSEWETIEKPVSDEEKKILQLIVNGYHNQDICENENKTFISYSKIEPTNEIEYFIFKKYFEKDIQTAVDKYGIGTPMVNINVMSMVEGKILRTLRSGDSIRLQTSENAIKTNKNIIVEYILIYQFTNLLKYLYKKKDKYVLYLYNLIQIKKTNIKNINIFVLKYINKIIDHCNTNTPIKSIVYKAVDLIEKNKIIHTYADRELYSHQKKLFKLFKTRKDTEEALENISEEISREGDGEKMLELEKKQHEYYSKLNPMLILYTAPTGTGKTLSPIGLSENYRIIFVCVARHIGMALAKAAISANKKIAFAFGCKTADDIRLHYYSAVEYTKNYKSGGIFKVDNSVGTNVEIIICDVQSYLTSMYYMLAFNKEENIITYWDEPTITMDYEEHELHDVIKENWKQNQISKMILSCATLPNRQEMAPVYMDFKDKFENAELHTITSYDCKKSIPILDKNGYCVLPHYLHSNYKDMMVGVDYCMSNKTLLRYFDLNEIVSFIKYMEKKLSESYINTYFQSISNITMNNIKEFYLDVLLNIKEDEYDSIYQYFHSSKRNKFQNDQLIRSQSLNTDVKKGGGELKRTVSVFDTPKKKETTATGGILATTSDAYTFTDGPTIYLTDDIDKVGQFYIQQTNIETNVFTNIMNKIKVNKENLDKIDKIESELNSIDTKNAGEGNKVEYSKKSETGKLSNESSKLVEEMNKLRKKLLLVTLDPMYSPNTKPHQNIWAPTGEIVENAFVADLGEENTKTLMSLNIENNYKVLLLLGIGTFKYHKNVKYMEMMKELADKQKLFMIIASTDYIYGTNYQFCHGFIGKDLEKTTQQKLLQAMGRIGRNSIQQDYTIRFRNNDMIYRLFTKQEHNMEAINICKLFNSN